MKKLVAVLMTVCMVSAMAGCTSRKDRILTPTTTTERAATTLSQDNDADNKIVQLKNIGRTEDPNMMGKVGGWDGNIADLDLNKNPEAKKALEKATAELTGMTFEGIYLLGKQIVSGTNYCILARGTATVPDAVPGFYLVYVYEDLSGNASVLKIDPLLEVPEANLSGGWSTNTGDVTFENNAEVKEAYEKALKNMILTGGEIEPVAFLGSQVVAGYNYLVLCRVKAVVEDPSTELALMTIYADLEGGAQITMEDFDFSAQEETGEVAEQSETSEAFKVDTESGETQAETV